MYNFKQYIYYTVHTCDIVSFCFCKAVSFCIIIYKLNYSSVSNKMFCSPQSTCALMSVPLQQVCGNVGVISGQSLAQSFTDDSEDDL